MKFSGHYAEFKHLVYLGSRSTNFFEYNAHGWNDFVDDNLRDAFGKSCIHFVQKKLEQITIYCHEESCMTAFSVANVSSSNEKDILDEWEIAVIDLFLNAANSFGLPKSYGQIYGLLFCRDQSLSMDEVMKFLEISKGSASQGLRALRQLGAVSSVFEPGDRRERFVAEIRLRKLVGGFFANRRIRIWIKVWVV